MIYLRWLHVVWLPHLQRDAGRVGSALHQGSRTARLFCGSVISLLLRYIYTCWKSRECSGEPTCPQEFFKPWIINLLILLLRHSQMDQLLPWMPPCIRWNGSLKIAEPKYVEGATEENKIFKAKHGPPATIVLSLPLSFVFLLQLSALKQEWKRPFLQPWRGLHHPPDKYVLLVCSSEDGRGSWQVWTDTCSGKISDMVLTAWEPEDWPSRVKCQSYLSCWEKKNPDKPTLYSSRAHGFLKLKTISLQLELCISVWTGVCKSWPNAWWWSVKTSMYLRSTAEKKKHSMYSETNVWH